MDGWMGGRKEKRKYMRKEGHDVYSDTSSRKFKELQQTRKERRRKNTSNNSKVKFTAKQAIKAQIGSRGIAPFLRDLMLPQLLK
jgi:hypothetical protein